VLVLLCCCVALVVCLGILCWVMVVYVSIYCYVRGDSCIGHGLGPLTLGWFTWFGCGWVILLYLILLLFVVLV